MKACKKYQKWLSLYVIGELSDNEQKELQEHLQDCPVCSADVELERSFVDKLSQRHQTTPSKALLAECRTELRDRLLQQKQRQQRTWLAGFAEMLNPHGSPRLAFAGAFAILLLGLAIGRYALPKQSAIFAASQERMMNIRNIRFDPVSNKVQVEFTRVQDVSLQGDIENEWIREALVYSLQNRTTPGLRIRAVNALSALPGRDDDIETALIYAAENDENAGVRLKAAKLLKEMPLKERIQQAFIRLLLKDANPAVRMEAVDALSHIREELVKPVMQRAARRDKNEYVRLKASRTLERLQQIPEKR